MSKTLRYGWGDDPEVGMGDTLDWVDEIPVAPWYVITTDEFMSGWGPTDGHDGRPHINKIVALAETHWEAGELLATLASKGYSPVMVTGARPVPVEGELWTIAAREDTPLWYPDRIETEF